MGPILGFLFVMNSPAVIGLAFVLCMLALAVVLMHYVLRASANETDNQSFFAKAPLWLKLFILFGVPAWFGVMTMFIRSDTQAGLIILDGTLRAMVVTTVWGVPALLIRLLWLRYTASKSAVM